MYETLAQVISKMREETGLAPFRVGDKVSCNLYLSPDIEFVCFIYATLTQHGQKLYLVNCPISLGFRYQTLATKATKVKNLKTLDESLYYRWVEENTLVLIVS